MRETTNAPPWAPPRPRLVILTYLFLVATNIFDAYATLRVIDVGVDEWNPVMRYALQLGPTFFVAVKTIGIAVLGSLIAAYSRRWRWAWWSLCGLAMAYAVLLAAHVAFLLVVKPPLV